MITRKSGGNRSRSFLASNVADGAILNNEGFALASAFTTWNNVNNVFFLAPVDCTLSNQIMNINANSNTDDGALIKLRIGAGDGFEIVFDQGTGTFQNLTDSNVIVHAVPPVSLRWQYIQFDAGIGMATGFIGCMVTL